MAGSAIPSKAELIDYTQQHPVWAASSGPCAEGGRLVGGLESLLGSPGQAGLRRVASAQDALPPAERRGPFLLPAGAGLGAASYGSAGAGAGAASASGASGSSGGGYGPPSVVPSHVTFPPAVQPARVSVGGGGASYF